MCRKPSGRKFDLCQRCASTFTPLDSPCHGCALPLPPGIGDSPYCGQCVGELRPVQQTFAAFAYTPPVSNLISQFKYHGQLQYGRVLTAQLLERLPVFHAKPGVCPLPELLVPVPLHPSRLRERGFNQALVIASQIGRTLAIPVAPHLLRRVRRTPPQQGLSARERKRNLRRAFSLAPGQALHDCGSIALVDDVVTTMSTVTELARLLQQHSKQPLTIHVWCLARA